MEQGREAGGECPQKEIIKRLMQHTTGSMLVTELLRWVTVLSALLPTVGPFWIVLSPPHASAKITASGTPPQRPKSTSTTRAFLAHQASPGLVHRKHPVNEQMNNTARKCLSLSKTFQEDMSQGVQAARRK